MMRPAKLLASVSGDIDRLLDRTVENDLEILWATGFKLKEKDHEGGRNEWINGPFTVVDYGNGWAFRYDVGTYVITGIGLHLSHAWHQLEISVRDHLEKANEDHERLVKMLEVI